MHITRVISLLRRRSCVLGCLDGDGRSALHSAARAGHAALCRALLAAAAAPSLAEVRLAPPLDSPRTETGLGIFGPGHGMPGTR